MTHPRSVVLFWSARCSLFGLLAALTLLPGSQAQGQFRSDAEVAQGNAAPPDAQLVPRLIKELQSPDDVVRLQAAKQLSKLGPAALDAVPMLKKLAQDPDEDVRQMAAAALTRIQSATEPAMVRPDLFLLSVGIDHYAPPINSLSGCVADADGMAVLLQRQAGKMYGHVEAQVLTDTNATGPRIEAGLAAMRTKGKTGDWYVIVMSGHGGPKLDRWAFITQDGGNVTDAVLLGLADDLAGSGKKVVIILDCCFSGQVRFAASPILNKHNDPRKGGIILMVSSMPTQLSSALERYSAFARSVQEGLSGSADYDRDQTITLKELRRFTYNRVYELSLARRSLPGLPVASQDSAIDASLSISETTPLARADATAPPAADEDGPAAAMPQLAGVWALGDYRLKLDSNGVYRATITDHGRIVNKGNGTYRSTARIMRLAHSQGTDRLEIKGVTSEELKLTFQGHDLVLRREKTIVSPNSVAGTAWTGTETLAGFGKLTFRFGAEGKATMTDARSTITGEWTQTGDHVTITFVNCVYHGTIQGQSLSGTAEFTTDSRTWTFTLTREPAEPPPATK